MSVEIKMEQHRCRICLEYSTETISIHDQIAAGVSYLDVTLKPTNQLELDGPRDEPLHICVPCANVAQTAYNFKESCERADCKLEFSEVTITEEKVEAAEIEDGNVITCTLNQCKSETANIAEALQIYCDKQCDKTFNLRSRIDKLDKYDCCENIHESPNDYTHFSDSETIEKTENITSSCSTFSIKQRSNIVNENELETSVKNNNDIIEEDIYRCKLCDKTYNLRDSLRRHVKNVHKLDKLPCDYCEYIPKSPSDYVRHTKAEHPDKKEGRCNYCDKIFIGIRSLKLHLLSHNNTKKYVCKVCGAKIAWKKNFIRHLKRHKQETLLNCSECGEGKSHIASKNCEACKNKIGQVAWTGFSCKICDQKFTYSSSLRSHNRHIHNIHETSCYFCDFLPQSPEELTNHIAQEHADKKTWACKVCGKSFIESYYLEKHLRLHEKNYVCNICGDKFNSKFKLLQHMRRHTEKMQFSCSECDKIFKSSSSLIKHMKSHENLGNPVVCEMCNKEFKDSSSLRRHNKKKHADKMNLACNQCDRTFFEVKDLIVHLRVHGIKG